MVSTGIAIKTTHSRKTRLQAQPSSEITAFHPAHTTKEERRKSYLNIFSRLKIHEKQTEKDPRVEGLIKKVIAFYTSQKYSKWRVSSTEIDWLVKNMRQRFHNPEKTFANLDFNELVDWYKNLLANKALTPEPRGISFIQKIRSWEGEPVKQRFGLGNFNEFRTEIALRHLLTQGFISSYFRSPHSSAYDHIGIDFLIEFEHDKQKFILPLQIKSSKQAVNEYSGVHRNINALCTTGLSISEILKILKAIINFNIKRQTPTPKVLSESIKGLSAGEKVKLFHDSYRTHPLADFDLKCLTKKAACY